jgi:hypothetical protein
MAQRHDEQMTRSIRLIRSGPHRDEAEEAVRRAGADLHHSISCITIAGGGGRIAVAAARSPDVPPS